MAKFVYFNNNFTSGEVSPKFVARTDTKQYFSSAKKLENVLLMPQGGLTKRPGTRYLAEITGLTDPFFIPFVVSKTESYVIAIDPNGTTSFVRIFKNDGTAATITVTANVPAASNSLTNFQWQWAQSADVIWIVHTSGTYPPIIIKRTATDTFVQGTVLDNSNDFFNNISDLPRVMHVPYLDANIDGNKRLNTSTTSGATVLTATDAAAAPISFFNANHVGSVFKLTVAGTTGFVIVTSFIDVSNVNGTIYALDGSDMGGTTATDNWEESAWSTVRGWPRSVCLFEQRLFMGGTTSSPDTVWASLVGNPFHFMQSKLAQDSSADTSGLNFFGASAETDPLNFTPASKEVNPIQWLSSSKELHMGTLGAEFIASGGREKILSSSSIQIKQQTTHGSSPVQPIRVGRNLYFVSRDGKRLMEFEWDFDTDSYKTLNLNLAAEHILRHQFEESSTFLKNCVVTQLAYQESRNVLWVVTARGTLVAITINKDAEIIGWHTHTLGGQISAGVDGYAKVTGICVLPSVDGTFDEVFLCVKRTINATTEYYIEKMGVDFDHPAFLNDYVSTEEIPFYSDSAIYYSGAAVNIIPGLTHLVGETVVVVGDGKYYGEFTVSGGGTVTLPTGQTVTKAIVGLPYTVTIYCQAVEAGGDFGTAMASVKRIDEITAKFYKTFGGQYGHYIKNPLYPTVIADEEFLQDFNFNPPGYMMPQIILFTGDKKVYVDTPPGEENVIIFKQEEPLPFTLLGVVMRGVTYD